MKPLDKVVRNSTTILIGDHRACEIVKDGWVTIGYIGSEAQILMDTLDELEELETMLKAIRESGWSGCK